MLGIDLGTFNTRASYFNPETGEKTLTRNVQFNGNDSLFSGIVFEENQTLVGDSSNIYKIPTKTMFKFKTIIDTPSRFEDIAEKAGFHLSEKDGSNCIQIGPNQYNLIYMLSLIFNTINKNFSNVSNSTSDVKTTIAIPPSFDETHKKTIKEACDLANIKIDKFISEPTAALLKYKSIDEIENATVAMIDYGYSGLTVTFLKMTGYQFDIIVSVKKSEFCVENVDRMIIRFVLDQYKQKYPNDEPSSEAISRLKEETMKCREAMTSVKKFDFHIENFCNDHTLEYKMRRNKFYSASEDIFDSTPAVIRDAFAKSKMKRNEINLVLCRGACINHILDYIKEYFIGITVDADFDENGTAVAQGCALSYKKDIEEKFDDPSTSGSKCCLLI